MPKKRTYFEDLHYKVFDFSSGRIRDCAPNMFVSRRLPFAYAEFDVEFQKEWSAVIKDVVDYWKKHGAQDLRPEAVEGKLVFGNPPLAKRVADLCARCDFLMCLQDIFKDNIDELLYFLQHLCRMMSAYPRLCELLYIHGPPKSGKDVLAAFLQTFFGDVDDNGFCSALPGDYFDARASRGSRGAEDSHPLLHSIRNARCVIVPEVPEGETSMKLLKPLCEQSGAKVASRTHNQDPTRSHPRYELIFFSNHNLDIGENPDGGACRRVNIVRLQNRFGGNIDDDTAERADLKMQIREGQFNLQMFHVVKEFYGGLQLYGTNIRRPARIERETMEVVATVRKAPEAPGSVPPKKTGLTNVQVGPNKIPGLSPS